MLTSWLCWSLFLIYVGVCWNTQGDQMSRRIKFLVSRIYDIPCLFWVIQCVLRRISREKCNTLEWSLPPAPSVHHFTESGSHGCKLNTCTATGYLKQSCVYHFLTVSNDRYSQSIFGHSVWNFMEVTAKLFIITILFQFNGRPFFKRSEFLNSVYVSPCCPQKALQKTSWCSQRTVIPPHRP